MTVPYHGYYRYGKDTYLCEWFNDTIFTVHPEALTPRYVLARGSYQLSMERLAQGENQVLHFPLCTYETDRYLWHEYSLDQKPYLLLYDKRSGKSLLNHEGALITEDLRDGACYDEFGDRAISLSRELSNWYATVAQNSGVHFLDAAKLVTPSPVDGLHLTPDGHEVLAQAMAQTCRAILTHC